VGIPHNSAIYSFVIYSKHCLQRLSTNILNTFLRGVAVTRVEGLLLDLFLKVPLNIINDGPTTDFATFCADPKQTMRHYSAVWKRYSESYIVNVSEWLLPYLLWWTKRWRMRPSLGAALVRGAISACAVQCNADVPLRNYSVTHSLQCIELPRYCMILPLSVSACLRYQYGSKRAPPVIYQARLYPLTVPFGYWFSLHGLSRWL